jgi:hypothetical protein
MLGSSVSQLVSILLIGRLAGSGVNGSLLSGTGQGQADEMLIVHADMGRVLGDVQREDRVGLASYFARLIERLAKGGARAGGDRGHYTSYLHPRVEAIHNAYMQTVEGGTEGRATLSRIAHQLPVDAIVLAGTDLSLIFDETNTDFPHVDCAKKRIFRRSCKACVDAPLSRIFRAWLRGPPSFWRNS